MAVKVLINTLGQHIVSEVKQVENKDTQEVVGYWLENPRMVSYVPRPEEEGGGVNVSFGAVCPLTDEQAFTVRAEHIVSIVEPREDVIGSYTEITGGAPAEEAETDDVEAATKVETEVVAE